MWPTLLIVIYCVCIVLASLGGGWLPSLMRLTHLRMQVMMSFVGGLMLGVALMHLAPHAVMETGSLDVTAWWTVAGLLGMFFLIRIFHVHDHGPAEERPHHEAGHGHEPHAHDHAHESRSSLSWVGLFFGLALHTLIDGVALAASVTTVARETSHTALLGTGTFLAVLLHKPLDALSIAAVMEHGGWTNRWKHVVNAAFALMCPLGALAFFFGVQESAQQHLLVGCALGFAAGVFLCISLSDILPEVHFHSHDRLTLSAALVAGVTLAYCLGFVEPEHSHNHMHSHEIHHPEQSAGEESH